MIKTVFTCIAVAFIIACTCMFATAQIADSYLNDINIENDPNVIFAEMFEQSTVTTMLSSSGYQTLTSPGQIAFDASVPPGSTGSQSLKLTTVENSNASNDPSEDSNILKKFSTGISDSVFVRYYVKYNSDFTFHHSGVWIGGTNSNFTCWPCHYANTIASGDSAFIVGTEVRGATMTAQNNATFGYYNYWMGMHPNNNGIYHGNEFYNNTTNDVIDMNAWNCIEVMLKLNNPVTEANGELALWINGVLISRYGYQFPAGNWNETHFTDGAGTPFEGFQFRSNPAVQFNYLWIKNYSTYNTSTAPNDILYDHIVVAKSYIGPINTTVTGTNELNSKLDIQLYPNPANEVLTFSKKVDNVVVYDICGKQVMINNNETDHISTSTLENGIYLVQADNAFHKIVVKH